MRNRAIGILPKDSANHDSFAHPSSTSTWATPVAVLSVKFPSNRSPVGIGG